MDETKHAPGPWRQAKNADLWIYSEQRLIAKVCPDSTSSGANARLIAAAPEMLEALGLFVALDETASAVTARTEVISDATWIEIFHEAVTKAEAAIRKAKGDDAQK